MGDLMNHGLIQELRSLVDNERGFLHKSFIGRAVGGVVGGALGAIPGISQAIGTVRGLVGAIKGPARPVISRTRTARPSLAGAQGKEFGRQLKLGTGAMGITGQPGGNGFTTGQFGGIALPQHPRNGRPRGSEFCQPGFVWNAELGTCVAVGSPVAARFGGGQPVLGQHGAGMVAGSQIVDRATCPRGMLLGNDAVCYNKGQIRNNQRMWPAGRKPLLTGGQMNAISIAARAGRRMELATKRLQKMGMMKKPAPRLRRAAHPALKIHAHGAQ